MTGELGDKMRHESDGEGGEGKIQGGEEEGEMKSNEKREETEGEEKVDMKWE